jgi:hypothetical protein
LANTIPVVANRPLRENLNLYLRPDRPATLAGLLPDEELISHSKTSLQDMMMKLNMDTGMLWFEDQGVVDALEHIPRDDIIRSGNKSDLVWNKIFAIDPTRKRKHFLARLTECSPRSIDRLLGDATLGAGPLEARMDEGSIASLLM